MGAGTPAKVPRKFWGTEFWESTGQTPGESAPQILGYRGLGPRTPNPTGRAALARTPQSVTVLMGV